MLPPTNVSLQSLPDNILQIVVVLSDVKMNRHFVFLVPEAGLVELIIA